MATVISLALLISTLAFAVVQATPLSIPLVQKIHTGHDLAKFWANQAQPSNADKRGSKLFQYIYPKDYVTTDASIGVPSDQTDDSCLALESFQLAIETGSPYTFVFSPDFKSLDPRQKAYNSNESLTGDYLSGQYQAKSGAVELSGDLYKDLVKIKFSDSAQTSQSALFKTSFGVVNKVRRADNFGQVPFPLDGVLGLSWTSDANSDQSIKYLCEKVYGKGSSTCWYSVWLGPHKAPSEGTSEGKLIFKDWDYSLCSSNFVQNVPLTYDNNNLVPTFKLKNFSFGNIVTLSTTKTATIDSGFSEIILPYDEYHKVMDSIDPDYNTSTNLLTVQCDIDLPDLTFVVEGDQTLTVTKQRYLLDMDLGNNQCALAIGLHVKDFMASDFVLGNSFLRSYCVAYKKESDGSLSIDIRDSLTASRTTESTSTIVPTTTPTRPPSGNITCKSIVAYYNGEFKNNYNKSDAMPVEFQTRMYAGDHVYYAEINHWNSTKTKTSDIEFYLHSSSDWNLCYPPTNNNCSTPYSSQDDIWLDIHHLINGDFVNEYFFSYFPAFNGQFMLYNAVDGCTKFQQANDRDPDLAVDPAYFDFCMCCGDTYNPPSSLNCPVNPWA